MNKKRLLPSMGAKKKAWSVVYTGTTVINAGSEASIDNLFASTVTIEGWFRCRFTLDVVRRFFDKTGGTSVGYYGAGKLSATTQYFGVYISGSENALTFLSTILQDNVWHHIAHTFSPTTRRDVFIDGAFFITENISNRTVTADAAVDFCIGNRPAGDRGFIGDIGWVRISNSVRYSAPFTPPPRLVYPTVDANTVRLFKMNEGTGTTITDYSANAQNATLSNGTWTKV